MQYAWLECLLRDSVADTAFRALANDHRRRLLLALLEHNPQEEVTVPEDIPLDSEEVEILRSELYHRHLPLLEELGFIEWNRETQTVVKGPQFSEIRPLLELVDRHRDELPEGWL